MARRAKDGRFELGGYWLDREPGRPNWYRCWYDARTGRVRRRSLGTEDEGVAKQKLASIVLTQPRGDTGEGIPEPRRVLINAVLAHYLDHWASKRASGPQAARAVQILLEFLFDVRKLPKTAKADTFGLDLQEEFVRWSARRFGHSAKYISRNLSVYSAAMHFGAKEQAVQDEGEGRRIVQLMSAAPTVRFDPEWIAGIAKIDAPQRRTWVPTIPEMGRFIDCIRSEHVFRFVILAMNTWARAETVLELDLKRQVDVAAGLVDLNPPGRLQTIKRRPVIRLTRNLAAWREHWMAEAKARAKAEGNSRLAHEWERPISYHGVDVARVKVALRRANALWMMREAGMTTARVDGLFARDRHKERTAVMRELESAGGHKITSRVIRSFMSTRVRGQREVPVEREQRQVWLGHTSQDTTALYEITDTDYLRDAAEATDLVITRVGEHCERPLWPGEEGERE